MISWMCSEIAGRASESASGFTYAWSHSGGGGIGSSMVAAR